MTRVPFFDKFKSKAERRAAATTDDRLAPVIRNLESVLNTKSGYGYFLPGFGLGEFNAKTATSEMVDVLTGEIEAAVRVHEPRIENPELTLRGRDAGLMLIYDLKGRLFGEKRTLRIRFDTVSARVQIEALPPS